MNEEVTNELTNAIVEFVKTLSDGKDFVLAQAPDVIQQLLTYQLVENIVQILIWTAFMFVSVFFLVNGKSSFKPEEHDDETFWSSMEYSFSTCHAKWIGGLILMVIGWMVFPVVVRHFLESIQIWIAPKVFLLEYAAHLVS